MTEEQRQKIERAAQFAHSIEVRNYAGNLSAGWLVEKGEEIANLGEAFQALYALVDQIRSLATPPLTLTRTD